VQVKGLVQNCGYGQNEITIYVGDFITELTRSFPQYTLKLSRICTTLTLGERLSRVSIERRQSSGEIVKILKLPVFLLNLLSWIHFFLISIKTLSVCTFPYVLHVRNNNSIVSDCLLIRIVWCLLSGGEIDEFLYHSVIAASMLHWRAPPRTHRWKKSRSLLTVIEQESL
jgi:hypothetical protein